MKTVNIAEGKWFHLNGEDAVYGYSPAIALPENFIVGFDIIPDSEYTLEKDFGFAPDRISTDAKGETAPLAPNGDAGGKARNRRVEFIKL